MRPSSPKMEEEEEEEEEAKTGKSFTFFPHCRECPLSSLVVTERPKTKKVEY